jgi:hypothetical protein
MTCSLTGHCKVNYRVDGPQSLPHLSTVMVVRRPARVSPRPWPSTVEGLAKARSGGASVYRVGSSTASLPGLCKVDHRLDGPTGTRFQSTVMVVRPHARVSPHPWPSTGEEPAQARSGGASVYRGEL